MSKRTVLIAGGGYGGMACLRGLARRLDRSRYRIEVLDASPFHTVKSRFHERAVYGSRDALMRFPLAPLVEGAGGRFVQDRVVRLDLAARQVRGENAVHSYDRLVLALGGAIAYFGVPGAAEHTVSLQTYEQAVECSRRVGELEGEPPGPGASSPRHVVVVGAGIEGLEVATMLRQRVPFPVCTVTVVERSPEVIASSQCSDGQREHIRKHLRLHRIGLRLGATIREVGADRVILESGEELPADLTIWCSGVRRVDVRGLAPGTPFTVRPTLQGQESPEVFAIGDFATVASREKFANLASAQRAVYLGEACAENLWRAEHLRPPRPIRYRPIGELIALGDFDGVGTVYGVPVRGLAAAFLKKANELKYLSELHGDLPRSFLRDLRG